ncbi:stage III sporulation protein AG [Alkalibacillus filiformis]|uniref:Stage III sporulation protein AG n=1 Tax=Alkalibacillus filiformis TaxID=200990 RepID=A0ABU0DRB0_9BACI|nr:stage III sporulation protein AG [Alkalibacillus filiformis]MDQ0350987.1 stage III sporulation protein AG [Alkalibacillus filiformis]
MNLKSLFRLKDDTDRPTKRSYILVIGLVGLMFLIVSNIFTGQTDEQEPSFDEEQEVFLGNGDSEQASAGDHDITSIQEAMQDELARALEAIYGVSNVDVTLQLDSSSLHVYEKNTITGYQSTDETDQSGGTRQVEDETIEEQTVLYRDNNSEQPLLIQTESPAVRGVLIVAEGVDQIQVKQMVIDSVSRLLDVSTHRIAVMPKGEEE